MAATLYAFNQSYHDICLTFLPQIWKWGADFAHMVDYIIKKTNSSYRCCLIMFFSGNLLNQVLLIVMTPVGRHDFLSESLFSWNILQMCWIKSKDWSQSCLSEVPCGPKNCILQVRGFHSRAMILFKHCCKSLWDKIIIIIIISQPTVKTNTAFLDRNRWSFFITSVSTAGYLLKGMRNSMTFEFNIPTIHTICAVYASSRSVLHFHGQSYGRAFQAG